MSELVRGSCHCGGITFEVENPALWFRNCHCRLCRKFHGAPFASYAFYPRSRFRLLTGEESLRTYYPERDDGVVSGRQFCDHCGSSLFYVAEDMPDHIIVAAGTLDGDPGRPLDYHIFVSQKAPWHEIQDNLPQYPRLP